MSQPRKTTFGRSGYAADNRLNTQPWNTLQRALKAGQRALRNRYIKGPTSVSLPRPDASLVFVSAADDGQSSAVYLDGKSIKCMSTVTGAIGKTLKPSTSYRLFRDAFIHAAFLKHWGIEADVLTGPAFARWVKILQKANVCAPGLRPEVGAVASR